MKIPTESQIVNAGMDTNGNPINVPNGYPEGYEPGEGELTTEEKGNSWGTYTKGKGWTSLKVFTGKAVREWILSKIASIQTSILNLLNDKLDKNDYTITKVEEINILPSDNSKRFVLKNARIIINTGLEGASRTISFNTIILAEEDKPSFPKVYFKNINTAIEAPITAEKIESTLGPVHQLANSYSEISTALRYFYIALPNEKTFTMVTSNTEPIHEDFDTISDGIQIGEDTYTLYCLDQGNLPLNDTTSTITIKNK